MSEEIDIQSNNLCTTEEAFEKFQAVSMYEEDEYITLSDIVSPPQQSHDITEILNDLPGEDDHVRIVQNIKQDTNNPNHFQVNKILEGTSQISPSSQASVQKIPKKRGRKKKNALSEVNNQKVNVERKFMTRAVMDKQKLSNTDGDLNYDMIIGEDTEIQRSFVDIAPKQKAAQNTDSDLNYDMVIGEEVETRPMSTNISQNQKGTSRNTDSGLNYNIIIGGETEIKQGKRTAQNTDSGLSYDMIIGEEIEMQPQSISILQNQKRSALNTDNSLNCDMVIGKEIELQQSSINAPQKQQRTARNSRKKPANSLSETTIDQTKTDLVKKIAPKKQEQPTQNKRGRRKKNIDVAVSDATLSEMSLHFKQNCDTKKIARRKQKNKPFKEDFVIKEGNKVQMKDNKDLSVDDTEDVPLISLSSKNLDKSPCDLNISTEADNTLLSEDTLMVTAQAISNTSLKIPKKRGRPKKNNLIKNPEIKSDINIPEQDEADEITLSKLKDTLEISNNIKDVPDTSKNVELKEFNNVDNIQNSTPSKRNSKKPAMADYEYNIDSIVKNDNEGADEKEFKLSGNSEIPITDSSRPVRRKAKKNLQYDEGSDEDPFANVELSDDEPQRRKKSGRYASDDEYFPGGMRPQSDSDSDIEEADCSEFKTQKRKKNRKSDSVPQKSPKKRSKKQDLDNLDDTSMLQDNVDFELNLETSVIKLNEDKPTKQNHFHEFENFLSKMTEIKIKKSKTIDEKTTPFEIPTIDPTKEKKAVEVGSQTNPLITKPVAVQTNTLYEIPMKNQVSLSEEQSQKAIEFLSSVVKTTSELGQLMTQKSEDFIEKRINTKYVTDTFKMDYCVKKSFLLLKLAKHNLVQMEEDLSKQYEEFLKVNDLIQHREEQKVIAATSKMHTSDSDCEIVEEPVVKKQKGKPAFNPKTVFLNKELSIKIAKKVANVPKPKENLNVKGRHTVWINDSIMVKKVKPTQSFLAQDSRNKKPPDTYVTLQMVSDFFKMYERQKALTFCAPYIETNWFQNEKMYISNYFFEKPTDFAENSHVAQNEEILSEGSFTESTEPNNLNDRKIISGQDNEHPNSLFSICTEAIQKLLNFEEPVTNNACSSQNNNDVTINGLTSSQKTFLVNKSDYTGFNKHVNYQKHESLKLDSLKTLCFKIIRQSMQKCLHFGEIAVDNKCSEDNCDLDMNLIVYNNTTLNKNVTNEKHVSLKVDSLKALCVKVVTQRIQISMNFESVVDNASTTQGNNDLCENTIVDYLKPFCENRCDNNRINKNVHIQKLNSHILYSLKALCYKIISKFIHVPNFNDSETKIVTSKNTEPNNRHVFKNDFFLNENKVNSLFTICVRVIQNITKCTDKYEKASVLYKSLNEYEKKIILYNPDSLKHITLERVENIIDSRSDKTIHNIERSLKSQKDRINSLSEIDTNSISSTVKDNDLLKSHNIILEKNYQIDFSTNMSLKTLCFNEVTTLMRINNESIMPDSDASLNFTINNINTISADLFMEEFENNLENINYNELYVDDEHNYSDNDFGVSYDEIDEPNYLENDETSWVSRVQMQELRSCVDSTNLNDCEKSQEALPTHCLLNIKVEPHDDISGNVIDSSTIKIEPEDEPETNFTPIDIITKQENITATPSTQTDREPLERQNSNSYDVEAFEAFVRSNKMIQSVANFENEIFSQSASRVRRQHEPDLNEDIDTLTDTMNLLIPQNIETAKDRLMESSSDEEASKKIGRKKPEERRRRGRPKKNKEIVEPPKEKQTPPALNEVTMLTRKMRGRIRLEEKKKDSSESEMEDITLNKLKDKENPKVYSNKFGKTLPTMELEKEIQCSDVDSTEYINENEPKIFKNDKRKNKTKTVADIKKTINTELADTECNQSTNDNDGSVSPLISTNEPIEVLQCTPSIASLQNCFEDNESNAEKISDTTTENNKEITYVERHGWKCYPIEHKDSKIYQYTSVSLHKLPESFVETYFKYQDVTDKSQKTQNDSEIDKLTNLQTLHRTQNKEKVSGKLKERKHAAKLGLFAEVDSKNNTETEQCDELSPSEDEDDSIDDNLPLLAPQHSSDNNLAKNILMNDDESDGDKEPKIKKEFDADSSFNRTRSGRVVKPKGQSGYVSDNKDKVKGEDLMLTADKMMNKELALLHAPVELSDDIDVKDIGSKSNRSLHKHSTKGHGRGHQDKLKDEDDSSSEEEKQWFTTKEKLLKRLEKKQVIPGVDDAKRTKIVNEFIEKRSDGMETRRSSRPRARRSRKKLLERRRQMKILSRELFGDESSHTGKKSSQAYSKGRRNIRKVIDKKLLARGTVLANMEEFERKRRLSQRQIQLREVLGCEDGVDVVVINDELCLEYDFEEMRPVVTVHPFFTKVMKAHQYEGVKFMWDACFESVKLVSEGHVGGGCILAHCMGLGKTLQVLALLHTVLTHPQVGMRRVLVCCPLSTVLNWVDEINQWIGPVTKTIKVFELSKLKKTYERAYQLEDWYNGGGIFIIGYELFRNLTTLDPVFDCVRPTIINKIRTALLDPGPDIIICDEGHLLKNDCSVLAVSMSRVVTKRRIVLTGTPMQNNLREYYCMVNFVKPNLLGTYAEYSNRFENPIMNGQHRDSREEDTKLMKARTHILHKVLEGCLQRQEASVLYPYLPKKHEYTVFISLTKCQWDLYKHYLLNYAKASKQNVLKDFHVLQKIWTHPQVLHNFFIKAREDDVEKQTKIKGEKLEDDLAHEDLGASEDIKPNAMETWWLQYVAATGSLDSLQSSNKFLVIFRLLDECTALDDKVLIFSTSLYTMDALEYFLRRIKQWSLGRDYYRLDGSVPAEVRQKWCREFNAPNNTTTKLFLISTRAGSLGLNMTAANRVIILDTSWNPAHDIQSIFRVYRFGQKKDCYIYRLVAMGTMEQKIYERSVTKQAVACRVVDEQQIDRHYNMSELSELYRFDEASFGVSAGLAAGVHDAALLRVAQGLSVEAEDGDGEGSKDAVLHAVHEHDSLLRGSGETNLPEHERAAAWMQFQQEHHTHNNMQDVKPKKEKKITKVTLKVKEIKQEPVEEPVKKYEIRTKKGRKSTTDQPSTSTQVDPTLDLNLEQNMVKKIMSILIEHGFHTSKGPEEIGELVANVRNMVANIKTNGFQSDDPLVASIAKVLLADENTTESSDLSQFAANPTESEEVILGTASFDDDTTRSADEFENDDSVEMTSSERKRRKQRLSSDEEYVPEPMRRKKAISKPSKRKSNDTGDNAANNVISNSNLNNSVQESIYMRVAQSLPREPGPSTSNQEVVIDQTVLEKVIKTETIAETSSSKRKNESKNSLTPAQEFQNTSSNIHIVDSIVLSDDDEPIQLACLENTLIENEQPDKDTSPVVPLHKSLLTNKNFIKIVAHTYLSGNPMLDEDAAVLAAQYSTLKALKEMEATKKDIISGPLYDIAKDVLGIPLLEKLQHSNKKGTSDTIKENENMDKNTPSTSTITENLPITTPITETQINNDSSTKLPKIKEEGKGPKTKPMPNSKKQKMAMPFKDVSTDDVYIIEAPNTLTVEEVLSLSPVPDPTSTVVPVGMFKGSASISANNPQAIEESILPDDDDIVLTSDTTPVIPPNLVGRRNSQQLLITNVTSDAKLSQAQIPITVNEVEAILCSAEPPIPVHIVQKPIIYSMASTNSPTNPQPTYYSKSTMNPPIAAMNPTKVVMSRPITTKNPTKAAKKPEIAAMSSTIAAMNPTIVAMNSTVAAMNSTVAAMNTTVAAMAPTIAAINPSMIVSSNVTTNSSKVINLMLPPSLFPISRNNDSDMTICLDSDEEDTPPVTSNPKSAAKAVKSTTKLPFNKPPPKTLSLKKRPAVAAVDKPKLKQTLFTETKPMYTAKNSTPLTGAGVPKNTGELIPDVMSKVKKAACNAGDVIRITESGKIEVLRRTGNGPPEVGAIAISNKADFISDNDEFITGDLNHNAPKVQQKKAKEKVYQSTSSQVTNKKSEKLAKGLTEYKSSPFNEPSEQSNESRSNTNSTRSGTLSVLKNVVHIEADKYDRKKNRHVITEADNTSLPVSTKKNTVKSTFTKATTYCTTNPDSIKLDPTLTDNTPIYIITEKQLPKVTGSVSKKVDKFIKMAPSSASTSKNQEKSIDLTDDIGKKTDNVTKKIMLKKNDWDKISGSSKEIVINKAGALVKLKNPSQSPSATVDLTNMYNSSPSVKASTSDKLKRSATWQDTPSKKMKPETKKKMTLKDFNFDDMDDIIELE